MKVRQIISERKLVNFVSRGLVYEWENILSKILSAVVIPLPKRRIFMRIFHRFILERLLKYSLFFEICPSFNRGRFNNKRLIPAIIDFYLYDEEQLNKFYANYDKNPVVLVSSKEVLGYLKSVGCPLNIRHWALSIPDKYITPPPIFSERKYDTILMHRQNPVLKDFALQYAKAHKDFRYIYCETFYRDGEGSSTQYFYRTSDGLNLGGADTREKYFSLLKSVKCGLYSTPGMDSEKRTNGFNQVTPRFLEILASGCHVIARYPDNPDTRWYRLNDFCKSVETYEEFEQQMDYARTHEIDYEKYRNYLSEHCTKKRAEQLQEIINSL